MRLIPVRRCAMVAAALALSVGALAGCAQAEPGVAAYVGDTRITGQQVDDAVVGIESTLQPGQQVARDRVVNTLIAGVIADQLAVANHIVIDDAQRDALLQGTPLAGLLQVPKARPVAYDAADQAIVSNQLGADNYFAQTDRLTVVLNPRYGVLDLKQKTIVPGRSGSLTRPEAAPTDGSAPQPAPSG